MKAAAVRLMLALAAAAAAGGAARAQDVPQVISPLRVETDHNNVNLVTGRTTIDLPVLSVPAAPNLRFDRVQNAAPYVRGEVSGGSSEYAVGNWSVHTGAGASESFVCLDHLDCTSVTGTGSTFRGPAGGGAHARYQQAGSGAIWHFTETSSGGTGNVRQSYASDVVYPNGERITYIYQDDYLPDYPGRPYYRPITITSNLGYFITVTYHQGELGTQGWNQASSATLYASAAPTTPLGRLTYSLDGSTITDLGGRVYHCTGCANGLGSPVEVWAGSFQLPNEASPALQVAAAAGGNVVGSVTRDGVTWNYSYLNLRSHAPIRGYLYDRLTVTGPNGFNQVYNMVPVGEYDPEKRNVVASMTDSINRATSFLFDGAYRPTRVVYPEGNQVDLSYDDYGNVEWRRARGPGVADIEQRAGYSAAILPNACTVACWRPIWSRDALDGQTDYVYNSAGQLTEQIDPADASGVRRRTTIVYAPSLYGVSRRQEVRICADTGLSCGGTAPFRTYYDYWGDTLLPALERRIDGATGQQLDTVYTYDPAGRLLSTDGPLPGSADATYNRYDVHGRRTWQIGAPVGNGLRLATRIDYRAADDKATRTEAGTLPGHDSTALAPLNRADLSYDTRRNPVLETASAYSAATQSWTVMTLLQRSFDDRGQRLCEARRMNPALFASPPADPCLPGAEGTGASAFGPDRITRNVYDNAGQLLQRRVGVGSAIEAAEASFTYNLNGLPVSLTDGNGNPTAFQYDGHMRRSAMFFPTANGTGVNWGDYEAYGYDDAGNRISLRKRDGSVLGYTYDGLNRMIVKQVPERAGLDPIHSRDVHYGYDLRDNLLHARFDGATGEGVTNSYDGFGRLASTSMNMGGTARTLSYQYDANGNRLSIAHPDGHVFSTWYDARGRPYYLYSTGGLGIAYTAFWDHGAPQAVSRGDGAPATAFQYDGLRRRSSATRHGRTAWRPEPESNRRARICSPLRNHSAIGPPGARWAALALLSTA